MHVKHVFVATAFAVAAHFTTSPARAEAIAVDVAYPEITQQSETLTLIGTVETPNSATLAPLQSGLVAEILVEEGQLVEKGQRLLVLDSELAELSLEQANAALVLAQANAREAVRQYEEAVKLATEQLAAETLAAERKAYVAITEAEIEQAIVQQKFQQRLLARHTLKAPFSGLIAERFVDLGEWVTSQSALFQLTAQDNLRLAVSIPQEYFPRLNDSGHIHVKVTPDFAGAATVDATLDVLVTSAANSSRTLTGFIQLPAGPNWLVGMSARADVTIPSSEQAIAWVPESAIKQHPDGGFSVFSVVDDKAKQVVVNVVDSEDDMVAVSGLSGTTPVVTTGVSVLIDGADLTIKNPSRAAL